MLYFSELKNKKVVNEEKRQIGRLQDLLFLASDQPIVTKLVVR